MDTYPVPARSLGRYFKIDGCTLARNYKEHLSDYREWDQRDHASEWVLLSKNMGTHLSIDESMHSNDLFTFLSNKDGHGKRGTLIAAVRGTKVSDVVKQLKKIPIAQRNAVEEVTMDFSDSMYAIVKAVFPNASIVIDCFHIVKRLCDGLDEMRMRFKRKATSEVKQAERDFKKKRAVRAKARADYREKHPLKRGEKRGRPKCRSNERFRPSMLSNGDTKVELLTRARYILPKSGEKWSDNQKIRAGLLFELYPRLKEAYSLVCQLRSILKNRKLTKEQARKRLEAWYEAVTISGIEEIASARDCIESKQEEVLNYFDNFSTNAAAESLNSKMKGFRAELRGVRDLPFYLYRSVQILG